MSALFVYITFPSLEEAQNISTALLEKRLVACANVMAPHSSIYWWKGKIESTQEVAVVFKTGSELFEQMEKLVTDLHSYDVPCVVALPIKKGHEAFLNWIDSETKDEVS